MGYSLLIVDDSLSMRMVVKKVVEMSGFEVGAYLQAGSGAEALAVMARNKVDLVLSDINMPTMSGMELLAKIKADPNLAETPVVFISTEGSQERRKEAFLLGAAGYLKKPFQPEDIRLILDQVLGGGR